MSITTILAKITKQFTDSFGVPHTPGEIVDLFWESGCYRLVAGFKAYCSIPEDCFELFPEAFGDAVDQWIIHNHMVDRTRVCNQSEKDYKEEVARLNEKLTRAVREIYKLRDELASVNEMFKELHQAHLSKEINLGKYFESFCSIHLDSVKESEKDEEESDDE